MSEVLNSLSIDEVSRDTGLGKDTLRVWERRYGFPIPERGVRGERRYPLPQLERLRMIRRLMDQGYRPGRILALDEKALLVLNAYDDRNLSSVLDDEIARLFRIDHQSLENELRNRLNQLPAQEFSEYFVTPMLNWIGQQWVVGRLKIHEEHAVTQVLQNVLIEAIMNRSPDNDKKRVLLTTVPGEKHYIGLLIVELIMRELGWSTINLGTETPVDEIILAAKKHQVKIISLSFSASRSRSSTVAALQLLNDHCPASTHIITGGHGINKLRRLPQKINVIRKMNDLAKMLKKIESKID